MKLFRSHFCPCVFRRWSVTTRILPEVLGQVKGSRGKDRGKHFGKKFVGETAGCQAVWVKEGGQVA